MQLENVFVFDIDGTLTPPRQPMTEDFEIHFSNFVNNNTVYLVSGSDIAKIREQVPSGILEKCSGIFGSSGNELWVAGKNIYTNEFPTNESLMHRLEGFVQKSKYRTKTGRHIELRPGMVNFSTVGRNADALERKKYHTWDKKNQERKRIAISLLVSNPEVEVSIGGEISIDIYPKGLDKSQAISYIKKEHEGKPIKIHFFGDKTDPPGNDYGAVCALSDLDQPHPVKNYNQTLKILKVFLEN